MLICANPPIKCWPHCLSHAVWIFNSLPSQGQTASQTELINNKKGDWTCLRTFGCKVWMQSPGHQPSKFRLIASKGTFPGCTPMITRNLLWHDWQTNKVKIATHGRCDGGLPDPPLEQQLPPNVNCLLMSEEKELTVSPGCPR